MQMQVIAPPFSIDDLQRVFPSEPYKGEMSTDQDVESIKETNPFYGLSWFDVPPKLLRKKHEVAFFFSPEAIRYFLPAFIKCSFENMKVADLPVDNLLYCFSQIDDEKRNGWRTSRWSQLTPDQWGLVKKWIHWLKSYESFDAEDIDLALESIEKNVWQ